MPKSNFEKAWDTYPCPCDKKMTWGEFLICTCPKLDAWKEKHKGGK